jgi:hypothetical protein
MQDEHETIPVLASATSSFPLFQSLVLRARLPCAAGWRGGGKVGILSLDFLFPTAHTSSASSGSFCHRENPPEQWECGNLAATARFPRSGGKGGNPALGFPGFPSFRHFHCSLLAPLAAPPRPYRKRGRSGDSILHFRSNFLFASPIRRAHSVSLIRNAILSSCAKLTPSLR